MLRNLLKRFALLDSPARHLAGTGKIPGLITGGYDTATHPEIFTIHK
ncbi:MAG: hypothetical protein LBQ81_00540 [Zoogloeaceae bacterium]|nr:hypothetical protein [Zoogloeaceae bacterium]